MPVLFIKQYYFLKTVELVKSKEIGKHVKSKLKVKWLRGTRLHFDLLNELNRLKMDFHIIFLKWHDLPGLYFMSVISLITEFEGVVTLQT